MQYTAQWGPKGFLVSADKIVPFMNLTSSVSVKADAQNDTSGTSKTNKIGRELQPITFSTIYLLSAGVDPRAQVEEWEGLVGESNPLIVGGKRFGPAQLMLESVTSTDILMDNFGNFLQAKVDLTFKEHAETTATKVTSSSSRSTGASTATTASQQKAAATYAATVAEKKEAMNTGATKADKATKKLSLTDVKPDVRMVTK